MAPKTARFPARARRRGSCAANTCRPAVPCSRGAASTSSACRPSTRDRSDRTCRARLRAAPSPSSRNASSRKKRMPCSTDMSSQCRRMRDDESRQPHERFRELAELDGRVVPAEARFDHHLLAVVRPPFDERRRREERRLADLRLHLAQMLEVQEVARIHLVNRDVPERREVEVPQVLFLALRRPAAIDVGQVVVRAAWLAFRTVPASTCSRTPTGRTRATARRRPARLAAA